jgi:hypothetical protein
LGAGRNLRIECDNGVYGVFLDELESESGEISIVFCVLFWIREGGACSVG